MSFTTGFTSPCRILLQTSHDFKLRDSQQNKQPLLSPDRPGVVSVRMECTGTVISFVPLQKQVCFKGG